MNLAKLAAALAGAFALGGCYPAHQAGYAPSGLSPAAQFETMYGRASPVSIRPVGQGSVALGARSPKASAEALVYSEEWQKREDDREAKLKKSGTVCRC
jgi:hypothetical protein